MTEQRQVETANASRPAMPSVRLAVWLMAGAMMVIAACQVLKLDSAGPAVAFGQPVSQSGARGVFAFTGQLSKNTYGVFMVDMDTSVIWCYEVDPAKSNRAMRLVATRNWQYDRYLRDMNNDPDTAPDVIEQLVEQQRKRQLESPGGAS